LQRKLKLLASSATRKYVKSTPLGFTPVEHGFEDSDAAELTNPCSTGVKPVGGKVNDFRVEVIVLKPAVDWHKASRAGRRQS